MRQFSLWRAVPASLHSKPLYRDVAHNWGGFSFLYLLVICILFSALPLVVWIAWQVETFVFTPDATTGKMAHQTYLYPIADQVPPMELKSGKLTVHAPMPYYIHFTDPKTGKSEPLAVIDTTGKINSVRDTDAPILITETQIEFEKHRGERTESQSFSDWEDITLDKTRARILIDEGMSWAQANKAKHYLIAGSILLVAITIAMFIWKVIVVLLLGIVGKILIAFMRVEIPYEKLLFAGCVAVTPAMLLGVVECLILSTISIPTLVYAAINIGYMALAVAANKEK